MELNFPAKTDLLDKEARLDALDMLIESTHPAYGLRNRDEARFCDLSLLKRLRSSSYFRLIRDQEYNHLITRYGTKNI